MLQHQECLNINGSVHIARCSIQGLQHSGDMGYDEIDRIFYHNRLRNMEVVG